LKWRHIAATWGAQEVCLYINGELVAKVTGGICLPDRVASTFLLGGKPYHTQ